MKRIGSEDARRKFRDLLDDAQVGESAEISRNGKPVAALVPIKWYEHQRAALAAYANEGMDGDVPVSAREVRAHVVTLAALLDGFRKYAFTPEGTFREYWDALNEAVVKLADLLPENAEED